MIPIEISANQIESKIYLIRGRKVMLDADLADLYGVETRNLNKAVRRNIVRFPNDFMFQLTQDEFKNLMFQIGTSKPKETGNKGKPSATHGGRRKLPLIFTQEGVAMLSGVLHSERAIYVNITIMRAFVKTRSLMMTHSELTHKLFILEQRYDRKFRIIFEAIRELMSNHAVPGKRIIGLSKDSK